MRREIDTFLNYLSLERGFSENTIAAYRNDLYQLADFIQGQGTPHWAEVDRQLLLSYIIDLKRRGYAPSTIARKVSAAKSLFKFLAEKGNTRAPTESLGSPKVRKTLPQSLSASQLQELLKQPEGRGSSRTAPTPEARRDKAMLELLYASGMRVSELVSLNLEDVNLGEKLVYCPKRGSKRAIPIREEAARAVEKYLKETRSKLLRDKDEKALFLNRLGERLTRQGFWQILKNYAKMANLEGKVTPNTLRHTFAIQMLRQGGDLHSLQEILGHANISTTQVYTRVVSRAK